MRKLLLVLMLIGAGTISVANAQGEVTAKVVMTNPEQARIKVSGNIGDTKCDEISLMIKKKAAVISEGDTLAGSEFYTKNIIPAVDGGFELEFVFEAQTGLYEVYLSDIYNTGSGYITDFDYISYDEALEFVNKLGENSIDKESLPSELDKYSDSLGIGFKEIENSSKKTYIAENVYGNSQIVKQDGIDGLKKIMTFSGARFDLLKEIKDAKIANDVYMAIMNNHAASEISRDIMNGFNALSESGKTSVCNKMIGQDYTWEGFLNAFGQNINTEKDSGNGSGSGSTGGTSSGSSNKTGVSGGGYVMITDKSENGTTASTKFDDLEGVSWAKEAILYLADKNIVNGMGDNKFNPNGLITREQLAKIMVEALDCLNENAQCDFSDVPKSSWAYKYVASAFEKGLMNGIGENKFGFGQSVTRQDTALVLYRFAGLTGVELEATEVSFSDSNAISDYAREAVSAMNKAGIINGTDNNKFEPKNAATRAQACKMIYEVMKRGAEK